MNGMHVFMNELGSGDLTRYKTRSLQALPPTRSPQVSGPPLRQDQGSCACDAIQRRISFRL